MDGLENVVLGFWEQDHLHKGLVVTKIGAYCFQSGSSGDEELEEESYLDVSTKNYVVVDPTNQTKEGIYSGEVRQGLPHGQGSLECYEGRTFFSTFKCFLFRGGFV